MDVIVNSIPSDFQDKFGFTPIDEPLLDYVFEKSSYRNEIMEFGKIIWVPNPLILLATKLSSYPNRDKEHKRIKDACDITALLLFNSKGIDKSTLMEIIGPKKLEEFKLTLTMEEIKRVSEIIGIDVSVVESGMLKIIE